MTEDKVADNFLWHRQNGHVSLQQHVAATRRKFSISVHTKRKIYLDLRFWILLRRAYLDPKSCATSETELLNRLLSEVELGRAICPISESTFIELFKQSDPHSRNATAQLIDKLSQGLSLLPFEERIEEEIWHSLSSAAGVPNLQPTWQNIWTKLPYVLGETHPIGTPFSPSEELVIQKAFFDQMWKISLVEMLNHLGSEMPPAHDWDGLAENLNTANMAHKNEIKSYAQAHRHEFESGLTLFKEKLQTITKALLEAGYWQSDTNNDRKSVNKAFKAFTRSVPTLHVYASCHAAVRWDKKRKLTGNDLFDLHHAQAALAYCDVFLTENPLKTLLQQGHLGLADAFACAVLSGVDEAIDHIRA